MRIYLLVQTVIIAILLSDVLADDCQVFSKLDPKAPQCQAKDLIFTKGDKKYYLFNSKARGHLLVAGPVGHAKADVPFPEEHLTAVFSAAQNHREFALYSVDEWVIPLKKLAEDAGKYDADEFFMHLLKVLMMFETLYEGELPSLELDNLVLNIQHMDFFILSTASANPQKPNKKRLTSLDPQKDDEEDQQKGEHKMHISQEALSQLNSVYDFLATTSLKKDPTEDEEHKRLMKAKYEKTAATLKALTPATADLQQLLNHFTDGMLETLLKKRGKQGASIDEADSEKEALNHSRDLRNKMIVFFIAVCALLTIVGVGLYFVLSKKNNEDADRAFSERIIN